VKAFAELYRRLDAATSTKAKQAALVEAFRAARADPARWASAAWMIYFLSGGKPRQSAPTRMLRRLAMEESGLSEWLFDECYSNVGDLAETLSLLLPEGGAGEDPPLDVLMREGLLQLRPLEEEQKYARLRAWARDLPSDQRFVFFKLITGELRVGVSRLQVIKALAEVAAIDEKHIAQRMMGYAQAGRTPEAGDFFALIGDLAERESVALSAGQPYPFYLAQSWQRPVAEMEATLGAPQNWIAEWKFDGIRAQLVKRGNFWRLWSRGEELISDSYPDLQPLADALPTGVALDGELVALLPGVGEIRADSLHGLLPFASLQQRLGRKTITDKTLRELPVVFIAYDLLEFGGADLRETSQGQRRVLLESLVASVFEAAGKTLRISPEVSAASWQGLAEKREDARALGREGLMLKAREGAYGVGRRKGDDRTDVWWKWKLDPMSVDAVLIYAQRGHGRRSGVYSDYTFALWSREEGGPSRELVPFAKAYSGLSDAEMREVDAIIRKTTVQTFGPVRSVTPTLVFELGFEGLAASKRHKSGVAVRFPRMLRWRRDKPVMEADTLATLRALLPAKRDV
jgi:DNA ligase-1